MRRLERANDEFFHLRTERFSSDVEARRENRKQFLSEAGISVSELAGQGRENGPKVAPVIEAPRTEETPAKLSVRKAHLRKRLGDCRLSGPGETVEPEHLFVLLIS